MKEELRNLPYRLSYYEKNCKRSIPIRVLDIIWEDLFRSIEGNVKETLNTDLYSPE